MANCLVTGGAGFIGSHVVDALLARGDSVRVLDNLSSGHRENLAHVMNKIEFIEGDIRDEDTVQKAVAGVELIFHLAAMVSVPESMEKPMQAELNNAVGTLNILAAARAAGVRRMMFSSTSAVYGDEPTLPKVETMQPYPQSPYAIAKLAGEHYCQLFNQNFGPETVIFRYFNVFGPRQDPTSVYSGVISIFVDKLSEGKAPFIYGDGEQTRDFIFVKDVARANLRASETPAAAGKIFNLGTGRQVTINQLFAALRDIFAVDLAPIYKPARAGDIRYSYCDASQARAVMGWSAEVKFEDGLQQLVDSIR
ncbi:MAG: SDR family oxidoreductase [Anaerolineae bacterium]|nr:SDR family oxidoreductase [Anaerolineae bacterium]